MKIAFGLMAIAWCLMVAQMLHQGRSRYIRDFCPNASDTYCPS